MIRNRVGQVTVEVAVLFTFVVGALIFMGFYVQRAVQGAMKGNSDSFGQQFSLNTGFQAVSQAGSDATKDSTLTDSCSKYSHGIGVDLNQDGVVNGDDENTPRSFKGQAPAFALDIPTNCDRPVITGKGNQAPAPRGVSADTLTNPGTIQ